MSLPCISCRLHSTVTYTMHVYSVLLITRRHVKNYPGESYGVNTITILLVLIFVKGRNRV